MANRLTLSVLILAALFGASAVRAEETPTERERQGHALAERMCASCHAIDKSGSSPHAGAPPFRESAAASISIASRTGCAKA